VVAHLVPRCDCKAPPPLAEGSTTSALLEDFLKWVREFQFPNQQIFFVREIPRLWQGLACPARDDNSRINKEKISPRHDGCYPYSGRQPPIRKVLGDDNIPEE